MNETEEAIETADELATENVNQKDRNQGPEMVGFRRVLLVVDESSEARAAARYADDVARQFGGTVATLTVTEAKARQRAGHLSSATRRGRDVTACAVSGPTVGARSHTLAEEVARAAEGFGADVVVLGLSRARLARHRLAPSLRSLVAQATEVPVLLAPAAWGEDAETGRNGRRRPLAVAERGLGACDGTPVFEHVVVGATDSESGTRAVRRALELVRASGGTLHVVAALAPKEGPAPARPRGVPLHRRRRRAGRLGAEPGPGPRGRGAGPGHHPSGVGRPGRGHHQGGGGRAGRPHRGRLRPPRRRPPALRASTRPSWTGPAAPSWSSELFWSSDPAAPPDLLIRRHGPVRRLRSSRPPGWVRGNPGGVTH